MIRCRRLLAVLVSALALVAACSHGGGGADPVPPPGPPTNPITFDAEFNGPAGAGPNDGLDRAYWVSDGCSKAGCMGTLAAFLPGQAKLDGQGDLVLTATGGAPGQACGQNPCKYASARLSMLDWSRGGLPTWSQAGGHFEARIKAPTGRGLWPAFWTVNADESTAGSDGYGEFDIFEAIGQQDATLAQIAHFAENTDDKLGANAPIPGDGTIADWHTYAIDWDPGPEGHVTWSVDGTATATVTARQVGDRWTNLMKPQSIILDLAVGGWAGDPNPETTFPARMAIDYIRVYRNPQR